MSLFQELNQQQSLNEQSFNPFEMAKMVQQSKNPNGMMMNLIKQNPQMREALELVQQNGGNPKEVFYKLAKQKGINPNSILNSFN